MIPAGLTEEQLREPARHALWRAGDLTYRLSGLQERVRDLINTRGRRRRRGWLASRRSGKSRTACTIATERAYELPGVYIPYAAPSAVQVRSFVNPHLRRLANEAPPDIAMDYLNGQWVTPPIQWYDEAGNPARSKYHGGAEVARFRGDKHAEVLQQSIINPRGCEDTRKADALRGAGTPLGIIDECRDVPILDYVLTDVLGPMLWEMASVWGDVVQAMLFLCTTAPRKPDHPFVSVWHAMVETDSAIHSTIYESDHLSAAQVAEAMEECGGEDTLAWQREGLAMIVRDPKTATFPEFDKNRCVVEATRPAHFFPAIIGDGGFIDQAAYLFGYYDFTRAVHVIEDELGFQRARSDTMGEENEAKASELWPDLEVERRRVDASPQVRADMNREEWGDEPAERTEDKEPPHWLSVTKPRGAVGEGSMERGVNQARKLLKQGKVEIHPRCEKLLEQLDSCMWNTARTEFVRLKDENGEPIHHYDFAAAFVYAIRDMSQENPYPASSPVSRIDAFRREQTERREDEQLRSIFRRKRR